MVVLLIASLLVGAVGSWLHSPRKLLRSLGADPPVCRRSMADVAGLTLKPGSTS